MRPLPALLLVLGAAAIAALGLRVMQTARPATPPSSGGASLAAGVPQGHVYTGCVEEPTDVNPFTTSDPVAKRLVLAHTHDALLDVDPESGELRPALAESFEPMPDRSGCTFTLREGVRFSDGEPVTLDDVCFGWELARAGHVPLGFVHDAFGRVERIERLDDRRLRMHFRDRHYAAVRVVGENWIVAKRRYFVDRVAARCAPEPVPAVDSAAFASWLGQLARECGPGTGAYVLDPQRWRPRSELVLTRNEHSWRRAARPGTWNFAGVRLLLREQEGADTALLRGEVDWYSTPKAAALLAAHPRLEQDYRRLVYDYPALGVYRVVWQCRTGPCADVRVRRALAMLCDTEAMVALAAGAATRSVAHCNPSSGAWPSDLRPTAYDPAGARALLREAGYDQESGRPLRLVVVALQGTEMLRKIADTFEGAAKDAGIELDLRRRDYQSFLTEKKAGEWHGLLVLQSFKAWGDPYDFLHSAGVDNEGGWSNADADRLATDGREQTDPARRDALWRELHTLAHGEQPAALLMHPLVTLLLARRIEGAFPGRNGLVLERAFVPLDRQRR